MKRIGPTAVFALAAAAGGFCAMVACGDDEATIDAAPDGGSVTPTPNAPPPSGSNDGGTPEDAAVLDDGGGSNPDDDGGFVDEDGGYDAGVHCDELPLGSKVTTTCSPLLPKDTGGELTTTSYELKSVTIVGTKGFCTGDGGYIANTYAGYLEVTASDATHALLEYYDQHRRTGPIISRPAAVRFDMNVVASDNKLNGTPTDCTSNGAPSKFENVGYTVGADGEKKTLALTLPIGRGGSARFLYVEHKE